MTSLNKALMILAVGFGMSLGVTVAQAGCGTCGNEAEHKHEGEHAEKVKKKKACVKCDHAKVCTVEDCADEAHNADCTCKKKKKEKKTDDDA